MKKKILFVTNNLEGGGAEKVLNVILANLDKTKYDITVYSLHEPYTYAHLQDGIRYRFIYRHQGCTALKRLGNTLRNKLRLLIYEHCSPRTFYRLFLHGKYDTEIAFIEGYATRIVAGSTNPTSKKLAWVHTDFKDNHWSEIAFPSQTEEAKCYDVYNSVIGVSKNVAHSLSQLYNTLQSIQVVYNPIDDFAILKKSTDYNPNISLNNSFRFVSTGRLVPEKGYDRLIPIIGRLKADGYNIHLYIIGEGAERPRLEQIIKDLDLNNEVELLGFKENPYPYIVNSDVFICSSRIEGYSTAVSEALILGVPVVTTECAGMRELLGKNSEFGLIVDNDDENLYQGIKKMILPEIHNRYKKMSAIRARDFELSALMGEFERIL